VIGRPFQPGRSGNPGGKRARCAGGPPLRLAQGLLEIAGDPTARNADRVAAYRELLDRGWGRAPAFANIDGTDPLELDEVSAEVQAIADEMKAKREANQHRLRASAQCQSIDSTTRPVTTSARLSTRPRMSGRVTWSCSPTAARRSSLRRVETGNSPLAALLEVVIAPSRLEADDALP